ncbi:MAG: hypothetical protein NTW46_01165 [Candidatus Nealsonbacteria bacterium]|nr:hypothetical protein [Candidatus Nealsonbacteria bacterium]
MVKKTVKKKIKKAIVAPEKIESIIEEKEIKSVIEGEDDFVFKTPEKSDRYYEATEAKTCGIFNKRSES